MKLTMHIDGGSRGNPGPAAAGVVIQDSDGVTWLAAGYFLGRRTNNQAEYAGLVRGLEAATALEPSELEVVSDSELLVHQINGAYRVKNPDLKPLHAEAVKRLNSIAKWTVRHVRREYNKEADGLANAAMDVGRDVIEMEIPKGRISSHPKREKEHGLFEGEREASSRLQDRDVDPAAEALKGATASCVVAPETSRCPAPCDKGTVYIFDRTLPAGVCLNVAPAMLSALAACLSGKKAEAVCPILGCGGKFRFSKSK